MTHVLHLTPSWMRRVLFPQTGNTGAWSHPPHQLDMDLEAESGAKSSSKLIYTRLDIKSFHSHTTVYANSDFDLGLWHVLHIILACGLQYLQCSITHFHRVSGSILNWESGHQHVGIPNGFHLEKMGVSVGVTFCTVWYVIQRCLTL